MNKELFIKELELINISLSKEQLDKLNKYFKLLIKYNKRINLTSIINEEEVYLKHFYDSLTLYKAIDLTKNIKICDLGTGAGFPGIVLSIVFPNLDITLIEANNKKIDFLNIVIKELELTNIKSLWIRMEEYQNTEEFDLIVSRAVAKTNILLELGVKSLKIEGYFILMKGYIKEELNDAKNAINVLGLNLFKIIDFKLPIEDSVRNIVVFKKVKQTAKEFPRPFNVIKKKPL